MRANAGIFIIISIILLLLVETVGAVGNPDTIIVTTDKPWVIANNVDQSIITITVKNTTPGYEGVIQGVPINLAVNDTIYGTLSPVTVDLNGNASSTFKVKTKSGAAQITANITPLLSGSKIQNIDHDSAYKVTFNHLIEDSITNVTPFNMSVTDRWGNRIDDLNPNETHSVGLHVHGPSPDNCRFIGYGPGYIHDIFPNLDTHGNFSVNIQLTSTAGTNYILMDAFGSISDKMESIQAVATGEPFSMTGTISPEGALLANNVDYFTLNYFIYDIYGNPLYNKSVWVNTTLNGADEQVLKRSNSLGQIQLKYGPKSAVNNVTITANSTENLSVSNTLHAEFVDAGIQDLVLIITPQILMSRELPNSTPAQVYGMVTGLNGFPIPGETVTFKIDSIENTPVGAKTGDPSFDSAGLLLETTAITDSNGIATVYLYPGSFNSTYTRPAAGSCTVHASINDHPSKNPAIVVEWKNYPYLSINVDVTPQTVRVNDTILFNITVVGNGYKMVRYPISVILDLDTSSSLHGVSAGDKNTNGLKRFENEKIVSQNFVGSLNASDQVGLVTYGFYPNNKYWELISDVSINHEQVNASIAALVESGGLNISIRDSIHEAVTRIVTNPMRPAEDVAAIIIIGDSNYKAEDFVPMVQETWTDHKIRIYSIDYVSTLNNCDGNVASDLKQLTDAAHGRFYCNNTRENIILALADIKQNLSEIAGANATMELSFENVPVNSTPMSGGQVFDYIPETKTTWPNGTITYENQSGEWMPPNYQLHFNIGTIKIGEVWQTEYRLKLITNQTGLIDLFASNSKITFNDGSELDLPAVFLTAVSDLTSGGAQSGTLDVSNLAVTKSGNFTDYVPLEWNLKYNGFNTTTETMWYSSDSDDGPWVQYDSRSGIASGNYIHIGYLDVKKLTPGSYWIKVHAVAPDAIDDEEILGPIKVGYSGVFIKLT
jgi:hypothetical protein